MCGIAGILSLKSSLSKFDSIHKATVHLSHRGPDDEGYLFANTHSGRYFLAGGNDTPQSVWKTPTPYRPQYHIDHFRQNEIGQEINLVLTNRRLSILDLSPNGHQPLCNEDQSLWIVHNGEIYNFKELKAELRSLGHRFSSESDTEVILHAYEEWGPDCLRRLNGMWAFAIWDVKKHKLFCSRDHFGIKPFYYHFDGDRFLFASEIKGILAFPDVPHRSNDAIIFRYLRSAADDQTQETFFKDIRQLPSASFLEIDFGTGQLRTESFWQPDLAAQSSITVDEASGKLRELLYDCVRLRLISDVPVGTCLSGGIDSSSLVCLINDLIRRKQPEATSIGKLQKTFSARYENSRYDEGKFIEVVTAAAVIEPHMTYPTAAGLIKDLDQLVYAQEEPFGTTSIFAQWSVFKLAKEVGVKVTLDGQGADELFAGYHRYFAPHWNNLWRSFRWGTLAHEIRAYRQVHGRFKTQLLLLGYLMMPGWFHKIPSALEYGLRKLVGQEAFHGLSPAFASRHKDVLPAKIHETSKSSLNEMLSQSLFKVGLPKLLSYDDRNSMAHSIESRVPFLDYRLAELAFQLPADFKIRNGTTKWLLREAMRDILPKEVYQRQDKIGFSTPEGEWFRSAMKAHIYDILTSPSFRSRPYFDGARIQQLFDRHCKGEINIGGFIWRWVNLELWLRKFIDS